MSENIIDVVKPILQGKPKTQRTMYVVIPAETREKRGFNENTSFLLIESPNGDLIYRPQEAKQRLPTVS